MTDLLHTPPITGRQLAEWLLACPNPDAPVFCWTPGAYWEVQSPVNMQAGAMIPHSFVMIELNACSRSAVDKAARDHG